MAMTLKPLLLLAIIVAILATAWATDDTEQIRKGNNALQSNESGGGKPSSASDDGDERKTLSQQVADGKYGLIQRELFSGGGPSAPGVLSYNPNPEVPRDNSDNLGGLARDEIWLAEDHLLVLRGGRFEPDDSAAPHSAPVSPIDDYRAPSRQVKIPSKPRVPPPFPVQLQEDGPIQILKAAPPENDPEAGAPEGSADHTNKADATSRRVTKPHATRPSSAAATPPENYGSGAGKGAGPRRPQKPSGPAPIPLDEDDPSIYYPPPYSFYYPRDNTTIVPPGPLVPGIVLPPPPNFFGSLTTTPPPSSTTKPPTITTAAPVPPPTKKVYIPPPTKKVYIPPATTTVYLSPPTTKVYLPPPTPTQIPQIVTQAPRPVYFEYFERNKAVPISPPQRPAPPPQPPIRTYVSSTAVPLRSFFKTPVRPAQYYFYGEDPNINEVNTPRPPPRYYIATVARPQPQSSLSINNFNRHIQHLRQQITLQQRQQRYQQQQQQQQQQQNINYRQSRPVYQYSFGYNERPEPTPEPPHYNVQIQPSVDYRDQRIAVEDVLQPVTPNPAIDHAYFTKQDEGLFDDITKKYFTVFGQKITSPLPPVLRNDININYRRPLPPPNPHAEYVAGGGQIASAGPSADDGSGTFISYQLPGNGAHFYFLTPQLAAAHQKQQQQRQRNDDTNTGYYYPAPPRL